MRKEYHTDKTDKITMQDLLSEKATVEELVAQLSTEELAEFCVGTLRADGGKLLEMHLTLYLEQQETPLLYAKNQEESRI